MSFDQLPVEGGGCSNAVTSQFGFFCPDCPSLSFPGCSLFLFFRLLLGFPIRAFPVSRLSGLVAGDSAICSHLAALILRLRRAGVRVGSSDHLKCRGGLACDSQIAAGGGRLQYESAARSRKKFPARELLAISVRFEAASEVATQIASDLRPRVEGPVHVLPYHKDLQRTYPERVRDIIRSFSEKMGHPCLWNPLVYLLHSNFLTYMLWNATSLQKCWDLLVWAQHLQLGSCQISHHDLPAQRQKNYTNELWQGEERQDLDTQVLAPNTLIDWH